MHAEPRWRAARRAAAALAAMIPLGLASCELEGIKAVAPYPGGTWFWNWDRDENRGARDNPVTVIFRSHGPFMVDRVYEHLALMGLNDPKSGSKMNLQGYGPSRAGVAATPWSSHSAGRKLKKGCRGWCASYENLHVRTYGPDGNQGTQVYLGPWSYYLPATVHFDVAEGNIFEWFGDHHRARFTLCVMAADFGLGWDCTPGVRVDNACHRWLDSKHYCDSDGYAWEIWID